jgi:hypothetical protein
MQIISQNAVMIKAEVGGNFPGGEDRNGFGIATGSGLVAGGGEKGNADGVFTGVSVGVGVDGELFYQGDGEVGFFFGFSLGGSFYGFTVVYETSGQSPAVGWIMPLYQHNRALGSVQQLNN